MVYNYMFYIISCQRFGAITNRIQVTAMWMPTFDASGMPSFVLLGGNRFIGRFLCVGAWGFLEISVNFSGGVLLGNLVVFLLVAGCPDFPLDIDLANNRPYFWKFSDHNPKLKEVEHVTWCHPGRAAGCFNTWKAEKRNLRNPMQMVTMAWNQAF